MKFSEAWLREWVDPPVSREALLEQLTMAGLEVDGVAPVAGTFSGVVVARVESVEPHPDADKLTVCQVSDGETLVQVVCGAPNVRPGLVTAFARVGAVLPEDFKIKKAKLRGVESRGMLCSASELGLGDDHDGILELVENATVGADLRQALGLDDVSIDLDLTPNRGDCLSLRGLAREIGVLNSSPVSYPEIAPISAAVDDVFPVALQAPQGCPRYLGRVIRGVDITRGSPAWLRERLRRCGLRSIDPVVDVTNYVMLELGQPMHAFDLHQLQQGIVVRMANAGEQLTLLDGKEVALDEATLLIADAAGPVAIAGVMGGERSGVQSDTRDVFLECAFFAPMAVSGTARRYGLHTDASHRYERGVDSALQHQAMERATQLLLDVVGGDAGPVTESVDAEYLPARPTVRLRENRLNQLVGAPMSTSDVDEVLRRLDFQLLDRTSNARDGVCWTIEAPSHRFDIEREADLVEEVVRIYGYNRVPARRPVTDLALRSVPLGLSAEADLKQFLVSHGLQEAINYSFVDPKLQDLLDPGIRPVALANPMSSEQSVMRTNMLAGLIGALQVNVSRQQERVRLFEIGLCFKPESPAESAGKAGVRSGNASANPSGVRQTPMVGALLFGTRAPESWHHDRAEVDYFDVKGLLEQVFSWAGLVEVGYAARRDPVMHPGQAASVLVAGEPVGRLGRLHPEIETRLDLPGPVYFFEVAADAVLKRGMRKYQAFSRYPSVRRDLALVVDQQVTAAAIERVVRQTLGSILTDFRLFDVYHGKGIDSNEKSLAVGLTLQDPSATLTEDQIAGYTEDVLSALQRDVSARLR